jgi:hypothetical protein
MAQLEQDREVSVVLTGDMESLTTLLLAIDMAIKGTRAGRDGEPDVRDRMALDICLLRMQAFRDQLIAQGIDPKEN